jgi:hypothetical protein
MREISGGHPSHGRTAIYIDGLTILYQSIGPEPMWVPPQLLELLETFYREKVVKYSSAHQEANVGYSIRALAQMLGLSTEWLVLEKYQ